MSVERLAEEVNGSKGLKNLYIKRDDDTQYTVIRRDINPKKSFASLTDFFVTVFLPEGYPDSVSSDYIQYQIWDSVQAFASSVTNTLATHAVLKGVGVGDATATPMAATITWLLRDGTGMLGRIGFAYMQGSRLDTDCKKWRLFADLTNDVAIFIDLLSPYFTTSFTILQCLSGFLKSLVGIAGGATRAALTQHQARRNNLADVSAKDGSQETLVNLIALVFSLLVVPYVSPHVEVVWLLFILFTALHVFANYRAVKSVNIEVFNMSRFAYLVEHYLETGRVLSVADTNHSENVWFFRSNKWEAYAELIPMGVSLETHIDSDGDFRLLEDIYVDSEYILSFNSSKRVPISVSLTDNCSSLVCLEAVFQAILIYYCRQCLISENSQLQKVITSFGESNNFEILDVTRRYVEETFPSVETQLMSKGWDLSRFLLSVDEWRMTSKC